MAKGVFTPTELVEVQVLLDQMWKEPQNQKFYTPHGETVKAIKENQTATFTELERPDKDREVAVKWADWCDDTATTVTNVDSCAVGDCDEADPKSQTYVNNTFLQDCFSVNEEDFQTSVLDQQTTVAKGLMAKMKNIYELFNTKAIAIIEANKGINPLLTNPVTGTTYTYDAAKNTEIPSSEMKIREFIPYVMQVLTLLRSNNMFMLDGSNFFQLMALAKADNLNDNGKADLALFEMYPYYNDLLGMTRAGVQNNTYMIDKGAMALTNRVKYPKVPREVKGSDFGFTRYSIPFAPLPGFFLDVQYELQCSGGNIIHNWTLKLRAGIFVNPFLCDAGNTGIWGFQRVADAA